jgi:hypothetical protein
MAPTLRIGPLRAGGIALGYRCPSRCRHCLYGSGPHRTDGVGSGDDPVRELLDALVQRAPHAVYHIGGGEPFLDLARLERTVSGMRARGLALTYVETNASWVRDQAQAEETLGRLARVGLRCVLVSVSPFHAEHVPTGRTRTLIAAARRKLSDGAFVWIADFQDDLRNEPESAPIDLDAWLAERGDAFALDIAARYGVVPVGRAGRYLHEHGERHPWEELLDGAECAERLADTTHFHVDLDGAYTPGLCAGIALPLAKVPGDVDLEPYPVLAALVRGGLRALIDLARRRGFAPAPTYSAACDLCTHVRTFFSRFEYPELAPSGFYDPRSIDRDQNASSRPP